MFYRQLGQKSDKSNKALQKQYHTSQSTVSQVSGTHPATLIQRAKLNPNSLNTNDVLRLQQTIGNRAATQLIAGRSGQRVQAKLTIGEPGDKYEQEADRVAAEVVQQMNAPASPQASQSESVQQQEREDDELMMSPMVQCQADGGMAATPDLEASINQARGSGQPLTDNIREPMEQAFGADFSDVKVHTDSQSHQLNQSIQARAFTTGQDVFFRQGEYNPGSRSGQELIAHELTHVVQQNRSELQQSLNKPTATKGIQLSPEVIQPDRWDEEQHQKEQDLAAEQNNRNETGLTTPGTHPVEIGANRGSNDNTLGQERHMDDDMLKTLRIVLNSLPPSHINGNPQLARIILKHPDNEMASYYSNDDQTITIIVPFDAASWLYLNITKWPLGDLATTLGASEHPLEFLTRDVVGTGSNLNKLKMVPEKFVEWILRHETGHSVDAAIGWMDNRHYRDPRCGGWEIYDYPSLSQLETQILETIGIFGDIRIRLDAAFNNHNQTGYKSILNTLRSKNKNDLSPLYRKEAIKNFEQRNPGGSRLVDYAEKVLKVGLNSPYEKGGGVDLNGRTYHLDPQQKEWVSYRTEKYALRNSNYQYQSPGEWFAETYSRYFIPPANNWGDRLKDSEARDWFREHLDPVRGQGRLIQGGDLVPFDYSLRGEPAPAPGSAPPPTRTAESLNTLKSVSLNVGKVPLSLVTRTLGLAIGTAQLAKIPLQFVYRTIKRQL
ncbi:MAG: DUF4157 domain-containing protein [Cyanomargarita calcarea GSE-NOS-MK-12-04C]|jgi:hypothetical protein|uniref:DUF4157 domain-containing protein n=1 Tax=Cyanomargarita calcarea GSE-NOS-MK-12-04C TaxID=2839659 RepID=A0A951QPC1_9CYAN|nr:DUF4157 domain-containing protein [Cyanomargarita calcarea GSE-NOS-MK-12-04C]